MTDYLSRRNRFYGTTLTGKYDSHINMLEADPKAVGRRLGAVKRHLECETVDAFARLLCAGRNRVSGWLNGYNLPPVPEVVKLFNKTAKAAPGLTLDWLYLGVTDAVPMGLAIRLAALAEGAEVPRVQEEPAQAPEHAQAPAKTAPTYRRRKTARSPAT